MERRDFFYKLGRGAAAAGVATLFPRKAPAAPQKMTLAAVGDCILSRRISKNRDTRFIELAELLRSADCTWGNCEMVFFNGLEGYPAPKAQDLNLICEPWGTDEYNWLGIDVMGIANNHTMDYGIKGLFSTIKNLERVGIAYAGGGRDLEAASRPRYVNTPGGRVGQVNCAASFPLWSAASLSHPYVNGRPGLNPLRFMRRDYLFEEGLFNDLWNVNYKFREALGRKPQSQIPPSKSFFFLGARITRAGETGVDLKLNEEDRDRIISSIKVARRNSRLVLATIHSHEGYGTGKSPHQFLAPFARACIDAGADAFFGTGPHILWGVEIYKGKPIFYSLGNFLFQYETVKQIPPETLASYDLAYNTIDPSLLTEKYPFPKNRRFWESVVPYITFDGDRVADIRLHPVELGHEDPRYERGTPRMAPEETGREIIEGLAKLSRAFGTDIRFEEGVGRIRLPG